MPVSGSFQTFLTNNNKRKLLYDSSTNDEIDEQKYYEVCL